MPTKPSQKKTPKEQAPKAAGGGKANALQQPLRPSEALAAVVGGPPPLPRGEVVSKVWDYIKAHDLQNPEDRREILADDTLRKVFGKDKCCRRRRCNAAKYSVAPRSAKAELLTCGHLARNLAEPF